MQLYSCLSFMINAYYVNEKAGVEARAVFGDKYNPLRVNNHLWRGDGYF